MESTFRAPEPFVFDGPDVAQRWSRWRKAFETYFTAAEIVKKSAEVQVAILLHSAGTEAQEIFSQFTFENENDKKDVKKVLDHFSTYCKPRKNTVYERYCFWSRGQVEDEAVDKWVKELKTISSNCEFTEEDNMIRDKIVFGYRDPKVKERMLRESMLTLTKALEICRAAESTKTQIKSMSTDGHSNRDVNSLQNNNDGQTSTSRNLICFNCTGIGHYSRDCPNGDNFPRGRRRGRGGNRGAGRGTRGSRGGARGFARGGFRAGSRGANNRAHNRSNDQHLYDVEEDDANEFTDLSTLSLSSVSVSTEAVVTEVPTNPDRRCLSEPSESELDVITSLPCPGQVTDKNEFLDLSTVLFHSVTASMEKDDFTDFSTLSLNTVTISVNSLYAAVTKRYVTFQFYESGSRGDLVNSARLKVDSGAEINVIPLKQLQELYPYMVDANGQPLKKHLTEEVKKTTLVSYGGAKIEHIGKIVLPCEYNGLKFLSSFSISDVDGPMLLGLPLGEALGIKVINTDNVQTPVREQPPSVKASEDIPENISNVHVPSAKLTSKYVPRDIPIADRPPIRCKEDLLEMYPECFVDGPDNCFPDYEYHISIEAGAKGKVHPPRRIPLETRDPMKKELERMLRRGAIMKVNEPTDYVNSVALVERPDGRMRICLDPTDMNQVIKRQHYAAAVVQDKAHLLNGSDTFTKLDLKDGYWHVKLDEESSYLTTFNTPFGRYRFLVMPFGLSVSQDIFQMKIDETYDDCEGVLGIADDINVHSKGDAQHDFNLHAAMERTRMSNLSLNFKKIELKKPSIKFFGNIYTKDGVKPDPDKVAAITDLRPPETKSELKTFLGMVNYLQQFIPNLSEHTAPLRVIEKKDTEFYWDENLQRCYDKVKKLVAADVTLAYYDRNKPVTVQTDYSKQGLGAVLLQEGRPVHYASKALVGAEPNYATIEGEMLAIVYATQKWHHYLYGRAFTVETDHKPLVAIKNKNIALAPPRIRGMLMATSGYDFQLRHKAGQEMVLPDTLSRLSSYDKSEIPDLKIGINSLVEVTDPRLKQLISDTAEDNVLQRLLQIFHKGWSSSIKSVDKDLRPYWSIRNDISYLDGLVMCGSRIIVPSASRKRALENIHEGHQGEYKCKLKAKTGVYWPGIYREIEEMVQRCATCQEYANAQPKCPMIPMDVPSHAWHTIGADLFHFKGKWFIIISDYFSKMPFVRPVGNTTAAASIKAMKNVFSENGIPFKLVSDNNPFNTSEFLAFADKYGFSVVSSSPEYPRGHGLIERHVQTVKKCMYKCDHSGQDFELAMLSLRATPLDSHLPSPAELLNGRKYRTTMPSINMDVTAQTEVRQRLEVRQTRAKERYDQHAKPKKDLEVSQPVRVYNKDSRRWDPAIVTGRADTPRSFIVQRGAGGVPLRRNRQHIKSTCEEWHSGAPPADPMDDFDPYVGEDREDILSPSVKAGVPGPSESSASPNFVISPDTVVEASGTVPSTSVEESPSRGHRYPRRERHKPLRYR